MFLAIVLVLGTITLMHPSFTVAAQAESDNDNESDNNENNLIRMEDNDDESSDDDEKVKGNDDESDNDESEGNDINSNEEIKEVSYGSDNNNYYKSKDNSSSVFVKKIKCNNINVNLNGVDVDIGLPNGNGPVNGPIAEAQAVDEGGEANSFGNDLSNGVNGQSDSNTNYRVVCINNNNNIIVEEEEEPPEPQTCEECFTTFLTEEQIEGFIDLLDTPLVTSLEELCEFLLQATLASEEEFILGLEILLGVSEDNAIALVECLKNVGVEFSEEPPV